MRRQFLVRILPVLALAGAMVAPGPAFAATLLSCLGSYDTTYDPGLTFDPQDVEVVAHTSYDVCLLNPTIASGSAQAGPFMQPGASCLDLIQGVTSGRTTVTWNTGKTTTYAWQATAAQVGGNIVVTAVGTVVSGKFLGKKVLRQTIAAEAEIESACNSENGLEYVSGLATLLITGP